MPLLFAPVNTKLKVLRLTVENKTKRYLQSLGFENGEELTVLSSASGNLICKIKDGRIALSKELCSKIFVCTEGNK